MERVEHLLLRDVTEQRTRILNRHESDPTAEVHRMDPPTERFADAAIAVEQEDVRRRRHGSNRVYALAA
ncbi:MAG: hypothetical protein L3J78_01665 [Thermoplasmata archaeon]|nr:hypothetical protein [Thermoplasmata archaeon]